MVDLSCPQTIGCGELDLKVGSQPPPVPGDDLTLQRVLQDPVLLKQLEMQMQAECVLGSLMGPSNTHK